MRDNNYKYANGGSVGYGGSSLAAQILQRDQGGDRKTQSEAEQFNRELFKQGIKHVESLDGVLMEPIEKDKSSARGIYQQRYSEIKDLPQMEGVTIDMFRDSIPLQEEIMDLRLERGLPQPDGGRRGMDAHVRELTDEYAPQLGDRFQFSPEEIAALVYFLGRQGTRQYLGNVLRDEIPIEQAIPSMYGPNKKTKNMMPEEYLRKFNEVIPQENEI